MTMVRLCPICWGTISGDNVKCGHCGADLGRLSQASYEEKLILALNHPIREHRMIAIQVLGQISGHRALPHFRKLVESDEDFYVLREVPKASAAIGGPEAVVLLLRAQNHRSKLVREVAWELITGGKTA